MADAATTNGEGGGEFGDAPLVHARALASHHGFVRALARGLVSRPDFEDVAQEALLAGLTRRPARAESLTSWLATTVRHLASKLHRGEGRRARREEAAAVSEALPSAHELVERIELEQEVVRAVLALKEPLRSAVLLRFYEGHATAAIAEKQSVPADTVRARLRRGLAELRVQLDSKFGRREHWVALLLPVAGIPSGMVGPGLVTGTAAAAAGATGAAVMGAKAITIVASACATAVLAWWALPDGFVARLFAPELSASANRSGERGGPGDGSAPLAAPASTDADRLAATRETDAAAAAAAALAAMEAASRLPPPGTVHFEVVDARTQKPLDHVKVHFLHKQRFADYDAEAAVTAKLTAGRWEANIAAPGYEPAQLDGFEVKIGETADLGRIALDRGNGVVEGRVVANHLAADKPVVVELFGEGRSPCDVCIAKRMHAPTAAQPDEAQNVEIGGDCGFRDDRDSVAVVGGRGFRFGNLAAGVYFLRACDPDQRIVDAVRLEVGRGHTLWQELDVSAPTSARFELRHDFSGLFSGAWSAIHEPNVGEIRYVFRRNGQEVGSVEFTPTREDTLASVGPPIPIPGRESSLAENPAANGGSQLQIRWFESVIRGRLDRAIAGSVRNALFSSQDLNQFTQVAEEERLDRERKEGDALAFDFGAPGCDGVALKVKAIRPDLHEVAPLPRSDLTVVVSCGDFQSDEMALDLRNGQFQPLVVTLHLRQEIAERLPEIRKGPPASCVACHGKEAPTDGGVVYGGGQSSGRVLNLFDLGSAGEIRGSIEISFGSLNEKAPEGDH